MTRIVITVHKIVAMFVMVAIISAVLWSSSATAGKSDGSTHTMTLDEDEYLYHSLFADNGDTIDFWITTIEGYEGGNSHPLDVYIATFEEVLDLDCSGSSSEIFTPKYSKEPVTLGELEFHKSYTLDSDDSLYLVIDNCDNQRSSDYHDDTSSVRVKYTIDDMSDEVAEGFFAICFGTLALMCIVPVVIIIIIVVIIVKVTRKKTPPPQQVPYQQNYAAGQQPQQSYSPQGGTPQQPQYPPQQPPQQPPNY